MKRQGLLLSICILFFSFKSVLIPSPKYVAITFDDGPKPAFSIPLLNMLDDLHIRGTFFIVGQAAKKYPDIISRIHHSGHELANHSYSHYRMDTLSPSAMDSEIRRANDLIYNMTRQHMTYFRPPGGRYNEALQKILEKNDMKMVLWDVNLGDYIINNGHTHIKEPGIIKENIQRVLRRTKPGNVILMHNGGEMVMEALPVIVSHLKSEGYTFVTLSQLRSL